MYTFAVLALLALALVKLVDFIVDYSGMKDPSGLRALLTFAGAFAAVWLLDWSVFDEWGIVARTHATGVWITGLMVAGPRYRIWPCCVGDIIAPCTRTATGSSAAPARSSDSDAPMAGCCRPSRRHPP